MPDFCKLIFNTAHVNVVESLVLVTLLEKFRNFLVKFLVCKSLLYSLFSLLCKCEFLMLKLRVFSCIIYL